jgi:hypothetical protein
MLAYRTENNVWNYFDTNGKLMWPPYADIAGNPSGWINGLLRGEEMGISVNEKSDFSANRQQVLYNVKGEVVFKPKLPFRFRILTGFDKAKFILIKDVDNDALYVLDEKGKIAFKSTNSGSYYLGDGVVAYLKNDAEAESLENKNFTILDIKIQKVLSEVKCLGFTGNLEDGATFCFDNEFRFGMLNRQGKLLQPMLWTSENLLNLGSDVLKSGFVFMKKENEETGHLFNKKGEIVLSEIIEPIFLNNHFFQCKNKINGEDETNTYALSTPKITIDDEMILFCSQSNENGFIVCVDFDYVATLTDKNFKPVAKVISWEDIQVLPHHFWIRAFDKQDHLCFDEKGTQTGTIRFEKLGKPAFNHVPFLVNGLWGLAHESGKIVIPPSFEFAENDIPETGDGFWQIVTKLGEDDYRFDFYDFKGKIILSTSAKKDGWDWLMSAESVGRYYRNY